MQPKYKRISWRNSDLQAGYLLEEILSNADREISSKNIINTFPEKMAKQIVAAQSESIQQLRSHSPNQPYFVREEVKPDKSFIDTIRPYSAKIQRSKKLNTTNSNYQSAISNVPSIKGSNVIRSGQSFKSFKSIPAKPHKKEENAGNKYKSRLIPLPNNGQENEEYEKFIEQLRKKKQKAQEYEKGKQIFLNSINKQNEQYGKRQTKFASTMCRKEYTYTYNGQIVEINKKKSSLKKRSNQNKNKITSIPTKVDEQLEKPQPIWVEFTKRQPRIQLKDYIFGQGPQKLKPEFFCPANTVSTKFTLVVQDC